ncbi:MAG TPA: tetratricopeptide repeat protein [Phycisphaerales bacterium]|nr:tetratricopeptide repeat protein [Phycisphaerales bacterium]
MIMAKKRFNWLLAVVLVIGAIVLGTTAFSLRQWQRNRIGEKSLNIGLQAYDQGQWQDAANNLGRYLGFEQTNIDVMNKYAHAHLSIRPLERANILQAIATYRAVLRLAPSNTDIAVKLIELYLQMSIPAEAELIASRHLKHRNAPKVRRFLAVAIARQNRIKDSAEELRKVIEEFPEEVLAYEFLARLAQRYPEKIDGGGEFWLDRAIEANPSSALAFIVTGGFYLETGQRSKAVRYLEEAGRLDTLDTQTLLRFGTELTKAGMYDQARNCFKTVYAVEPKNLILWKKWAMLAMKVNSKDEMIEVAETGSRKLGYQSIDFMSTTAELFISAENFDQAVECIGKLRALDLEPDKVAYLQGMLAQARDQNHKTVKFWREAVSLGNKTEKMRLDLASALYQSGDKQSAMLQLRELISENPDSFLGHFRLAIFMGRNGNLHEAAEHAHWAVKLAPENIDAMLLYNKIRMNLADGYTMGNKLTIDEIAQQTDAMEKITSGDPKVKLARFQIAMHRKRYDQAGKILDELKKNGEMKFEVALAEIDLLSAMGKVDEAIAKLYAMIKDIPQDMMPVRYVAVLLAGHGSKEDCESVLKEAIRRIDDSESRREIGLLMASFYDQWNESGKSLQLLETLAEQLPFDISIRRRLLKYNQIIADPIKASNIIDSIRTIEGHQGWQWRYEQARVWYAGENFKKEYFRMIDLLKENLTANPQDQLSRILLGAVYEKAGELQMALAMYKQVLNKSPDDVAIVASTAALLYKMQEYEQADEILSLADGKMLADPRLSNLELKNNIRKGKLSSAETILQDLVVRDPNNQSMQLSLALLKTRMKKYQSASDLLQELRAKDPDSLTITAALVQLNVERKWYQEALSLCDQAVEKFNDAPVYILRGQTHDKFGKKELAVADFTKATKIDPYNANAWLYRSVFYASQGMTEEAIKDIERAMSLDSENIQAAKQAVILLLSSSEPSRIQQAEELLATAAAKHPDDLDLKMYRAGLLLAKATAPSQKEAMALLEKIADDCPGAARAWAMLAKVHLKSAQFGKAMDTVLRGLTYSPNDKGLLLLKAETEANRSPAIALPTLRSLWQLDPGDMELTVKIAEMYIASQQPRRAVEFLLSQTSNIKQEDEPEVYTALAVALYKDKKIPQAHWEFEELYETVDDDRNIFITEMGLFIEDGLWEDMIVRVNHRLERYPDDDDTIVKVAANSASVASRDSLAAADKILTMVTDKYPRSTEAILTRALILHIEGRTSEAEQLYRKVIEIKPDSVIAVNNLAWMMCEEQGKHLQALKLTEKALKNAPDYIDLLDTRGMIHYRMGKYKKAVDDFTKCVKLYPRQSPTISVSYFHLARALAASDQRHTAIENMERSLEINKRLGGLSMQDLTEAKRLRQQLLQENNNATVIR